jgi:hypothetical protein
MKSPRSAQLIKHHAMRIYVRAELELHAFLTSQLDGRDSTVLPAGGISGTRSSLDAVERRKTSHE